MAEWAWLLIRLDRPNYTKIGYVFLVNSSANSTFANYSLTYNSVATKPGLQEHIVFPPISDPQSNLHFPYQFVDRRPSPAHPLPPALYHPSNARY
jgi:hypothetical protein